MKTIAIIGSGIMAKNLAIHARKIGVRTICFSHNPYDIAVDAVDKFHKIDIFDKDKILEICKNEEINGVLPTTELTLAVSAYISSKMGLNGNPLSVMENIDSKKWVRDRITNAKVIKQPKYFHISTKDDKRIIQKLDYPVIVKPVGEGGKRGINIAHDDTEFERCVREAFVADKRKRGVIIEEFIPSGMECSVEGLSYHGYHQIIQVTQNLSSGAPHCVELGHSQPADLSVELRDKIELSIKELLDLTGFINGASHTEIKIYNNEVYLIELNSRLGGDGIAFPLTILSTDYDYLSEVIHVSMDLAPKEKGKETHVRYSGIRFVTLQTNYLKEIFENCEQEPWLYEKNKCTESLIELTYNDIRNTNYFIYSSDVKLIFDGEEKYNNF